MAEESEDLEWLLRPPEPGRVQIHIRLGEGVELDPTQRAALDTLLGEIFDAEVEGFALGATTRCRPLTCEPRSTTCATDFCGKFSCDVGVIGGMGGMSARRFGAT